MKKVQLGQTGAAVSALCLGTDYFGSRTDRGTSFRLLDHFVEAGGTFVDTANVYASWLPGCVGGESETAIGRWLKERQIRSRVFIATKLGFPFPGTEGGLRAKEIQTECERSLTRLGTDVIDLCYAHCDDRQTPLEETVEAFHRLVQAGKVRFVGASNFSVWRLAEARLLSQIKSWSAYCAIEQRHTYLRPKPGTTASFAPNTVANDDLFDYCRVHKIAFVAYSILLGGAYTRPDRPLPEQYVCPDCEARLAALHLVAEEVGATPNQVVIAWLRQSDPPVIPIVAGSTPEQLSENFKALEIKLSKAHMIRLNEAGV